MDIFYSCDWGTSSFRLRLVSTEGFRIIAEEKSDEGISAIHNLWSERKERNEKRFNFYLSILKEKIESLKKKVQTDFKNIPLVISGMASSTIGMLDLPYKALPVNTDGSDLVVKTIEKTIDFPHDIILISGLRSDEDVIRGEETQLIGAIGADAGGLFIFPGTHSKHILVEEGIVREFKTYMTGEFFHLLATKSILSSSVDLAASFGEAEHNSFSKAVRDVQTANILHGSFLVRTNYLFEKYSKQENYYYLSGLLIGYELKEIIPLEHAVVVVGSEELCSYYKIALDTICPGRKVESINSDEATIKGQYKIWMATKKCS